MKVKFNGGIKDVPLSEVTPANYIVPQGEEKSWHVIQEKKEFDRNTGRQLSRPVLQKYDMKCYPQTRKYLMDAGYTITVLHDPTRWVNQNSQKTQARTQGAGLTAKDIAAMKAQLRAELKAELKAEMEAEKKAKKNSKKKA